MLLETMDVFFDTDVLRASPICDGLDDIINDKDFNIKLNLKLVISEIVLWEFQRYFVEAAKRALNSYNGSGKTLNEFLNQRNKERKVEEKKLFSMAAGIFKKKGIKIVKVPYQKINFRNLANLAAFYKFPFTEKEKGFRDSLTVETTFYHAKKYSGHKIVLISHDKNVRAFAGTRTNEYKNLSIYSSIPEFISNTKLYLEKLDKDFIIKVSEKSNKEFCDLSNGDSLYVKENLEIYLNEKYQSLFESPNLNKIDYGVLNSLDPYLNTAKRSWSPANDGFFSVSKSEFVEKNDSNIYKWKTTVVFKRRYSEEYGMTDALVPSHFIDYIIEFEIEWSSEIDDDANFSNSKFIQVVNSNPTVKDVNFFSSLTENVQSTISGMATLPVFNIGNTIKNVYDTAYGVATQVSSFNEKFNETMNSIRKVNEIARNVSFVGRNNFKIPEKSEVPNVNREKKSEK